MSVDRDEVKRIAELARLRLADGEADRLTSELNEILDHMVILRSLPRAGGEGGDERSALRSTRSSEDGSPDSLTAGPADFAPRWSAGFFVVPAPPGVQPGGDDE